jgi:hypothetical protein
LRPGGTSSSGGNGETNPTNPAMPVILQVSQSNSVTDINGLASAAPTAGGFSAPLEVDVAATAGVSGFLDYPLQLLPAPSTGTAPPSIGKLPVRVVRPIWIEEDSTERPNADNP